MKTKFLSLLSIAFIVISCSNSPFKISKDQVGVLHKEALVKDLKSIYAKDSIAENITNIGAFGFGKNINILDKKGKLLVVLTPEYQSDSTAVIKTVQIIDSRYKTDKGITTQSTFKDIKSNYKISSIDNLINSVVVSVNDLNASFTIDKADLPADIRFDSDIKIETENIPDTAKIKYFFINW